MNYPTGQQPCSRKAGKGPTIEFPCSTGALECGGEVEMEVEAREKFEKSLVELCRVHFDSRFLRWRVSVTAIAHTQETRCSHSVTWISGECRSGL